MTDGQRVAERPKLGITVPREEWDEFVDAVEERWSGWVPYAGFELDVAWREWRDVHPIEEHANRLLEAAGLPRDGGRKEKPAGVKPLSDYADDEKIRTRVRVDRTTREGIRQYAKAEGVPQHEVVRWLLAWRLEGGRDDRLAEKLDRVVDDAEAALRTAQGDVGGLTKGEKMELAIAQRLDAEFTATELHDAIDAVTRGTDYYHEEYGPRVVERKGVVEHPENEDLYIQPEQRDRLLREQASMDADDALGTLSAAVADGGREDER